MFIAGGLNAKDAPERTLITNVHVFDGVNEARVEIASVMIEGDPIAAVSSEPIDPEGSR